MTDTVDVGVPTHPLTIAPGGTSTSSETLDLSGRLALARNPVRSTRRSWAPPYVRRALALDVVAAAIAAVAGATLASSVGAGAWSTSKLASPFLLVVLFSPVAWIVTVALSRGYERRFLGVGTEEFRALARAAVRLLAVTGLVSYVTADGRPYLPHSYVLSFFPSVLLSSLLLRYALRKHLHRQRAQGRSMQRTIVVGRADSTLGIIRELRRAPSHGLQVVAACTSTLNVSAAEPTSLAGVQMLGSVKETLAAVDLVNADVVVVASHSDMTGPELRRLSWALEARDVELIVSPGIMEVAGPRLSIRPAAGLSLLHVEKPSVAGARLLGKVIFDRCASLLISLLILPISLLVALAIKLDSRGPVLFRQTRIGAKGEPFTMLKFRSMVVDAEDRLSEVAADGNDGNGVLFKQREDPRVTRAGRFIRRYSLDELPQLINVLRGDMSLVGPRPPLPSEVEGYEPDAVRRLRVRPGLTGLWQVSGRSDLSWDESLRLDLRYVDNWSMILDLQILWKTARAVLRGSGAY